MSVHRPEHISDPDFLSFVFGDILRQIPSELLNSEPALLVPFRLSDYITSVLIDMLKMVQGQSFTLPTLDELFVNATHVRELLGQSDVAPEIIDTFLSLSMQVDKMTYLFVTPNAFAELCASGQFATFFTLPPDSPTDISVVEEVFCGTNVTVLVSELDDVLKFTDIQNEINRILSLDPTLPPFNQTAATLRQQELAALIAALVADPPQVVVDPAWWLTVANRTEVILAQWLARLTEQSMSPDTIPGLDSLIAQLRMLEMTGESPQWFRTILAQLELSQYVSTAVTEWLARSNGTVQMLPTFEELFPDPDIIRQLLAESGLPAEVVEGFMGLAPLSDQWINLFLTEEPVVAICQTSLFQDVFEQTVNATFDVQSIQAALCSINLTSIDNVLSSIFMSNRLTIELVQVLFNLPDVEVQLAINISQEASQIIQSLIANPLQYSTELARFDIFFAN
ncbi:uncharacterized protein [Diadema antillarum]|uniref:uncharacterized protein n=1 Tax=Diadema antillarum TaxID=105358 RepID=UPI003A862E89